MENIHLQIMLSDVGYSSPKRTVTLSTAEERKGLALPWSKLIEYRSVSSKSIKIN
jgi:hypothetical protein